MYWFTLFFFLILPAGMAAFLLWRAYQMGIRQRTELTRQWLVRPPQGIERCARLFAWRDLIFASGILIYLVLLVMFPAVFIAWISLLAMFSFFHQGFTAYALHKLRNKAPA